MNNTEKELEELRALLRGVCPECRARAEVTVEGRASGGTPGLRHFSCEGGNGDEGHEESSWTEETVAERLYEIGYGEEFVREFLRRRGAPAR